MPQECWEDRSAGGLLYPSWTICSPRKPTSSDQSSVYESFRRLADTSWGTNPIVLQGVLPDEQQPRIKVTYAALKGPSFLDFYWAFQIAQKLLSVAAVSSGTVLFLSYSKWKGPRAFPDSLENVLKGKKKVHLSITDASPEEFQGENESVWWKILVIPVLILFKVISEQTIHC